MQTTTFHDLGEAEVDDLQISVICLRLEKEVLWLQIAMNNVLSVAVVQGLQDLAENDSCLIFFKELSLDNPVKKLATST